MTVEVTLNNDLPAGEMTALALHGQGLPADRVGAGPGGSVTYTFVATRPGTFLYEAGMTPNGARQVAMGLYGVLIVQPAGPASTDDVVLVLSEIDPDLNAAPNSFDMGDYRPRYWLINGQAYPNTDPISVPSGGTLRVQYVNAGLNENSMGLLGLDQEVIANDGYALPISHRAVAETIPPGGTLDTLLSIPAETAVGAQYPLYSTAQHLDNDGAAYGGQLILLEVTEPPPPPAPAADTTGPLTADISGVPALTNASTSINLAATATDTESNITAAEYSIDGGTPIAMVGTFGSPAVSDLNASLPVADLAALADGSHTISVRSQDAAGNWGALASVAFTLDRAGPSATGSVTPSDPTTADVVSLTATFDDALSGGSNVVAAEFFIVASGGAPGPDGSGTAFTGSFGSPSVGDASADLGLLAAGVYDVYVHGQDAAGNWGSLVLVTITVTDSG
jgi:FtsP/CotA-like multicopper oxidase with cupredoxin domain